MVVQERSPSISTVASPKSNWACPGGCDSGTNTSFEAALARITAICTWE